MVDVSVAMPGLTVANPLLLASGVQGGTAAALHRVAAAGAGGLVTKSIGPVPRPMYAGPVCIEAMENVVLNAMGLPNPGVESFARTLRDETFAVPVLVSMFAGDPVGFADVAEQLVEAGATSLELNLSCPHSTPGSRGLIIGQQPELIREVVAEVRARVTVPLYAKLTPNTTRIVDEAAAALEGGADGLTLINTVAALDVDPLSGRPILGNLLGGMSGPAVRPIALRKVAEVTLAMRRGEIPTAPVLGVGGISDGHDVARFIMLGATAVQVGSALIHHDVAVFDAIMADLTALMEQEGWTSLEAMRGVALDSLGGIA